MTVIGFAGYSGAGKTTLVERLIPVLKLQGQRVSVVKHAHHKFDIDHPGKDTFRHREAGAFEVVVASDRRLALIREFEQPAKPTTFMPQAWPGNARRCRPSRPPHWRKAGSRGGVAARCLRTAVAGLAHGPAPRRWWLRT